MKLAQLTFLIFTLGIVATSADEAKAAAGHDDAYQEIVAKEKWTKSFNNGRRILKEISDNNQAKKKIDIAAFRGEKVSFVGGGAPPGATNDLLIEQGYYVRIITPDGKDLRPNSVWWEVLIQGEILQVYPEHKIIVLKIVPEDWKVIQTG